MEKINSNLTEKVLPMTNEVTNEEYPDYVKETLLKLNQKQIRYLYCDDSSDRVKYLVTKVLDDNYAVLKQYPPSGDEVGPNFVLTDKVFYIGNIPDSNTLKENIGSTIKLERNGFKESLGRTE